MRVLLAVTHLLGAGHLSRAAAIARAVARTGGEATLVSGGTTTPLIDVDGLSFVQLPPVLAAVGSFTTLLDENRLPIGPDRLQARRELLLATFQAVAPDIVVTELHPFGRRVLAAEFDALAAAVEAASPRPLLVSSIRDILVAPSKPGKLDATHERLRRAFDAVLVHGDERIVPLEASWPLAADLRRLIRYTGYVDASPEAAGRYVARRDGSVLVSGGSSAAALPLYRAALDAACLDGDRPWRVLVGHGVDAAEFESFRREAPRNACVERARPDFRTCLAQAAVFVGQAGYNTVMDILATRSASVLVPFEQGQETEQRLRAEELARRGYADLLPEAELDGPTLLRRVAAALHRPWPTGEDIRLDGAGRTAAILAELLGARRARTSGAVLA